MSPALAALIAAAIQSIAQIASQLASGSIDEAQAESFLKAVSDHYNASVAAWQAAGTPTTGATGA